MHDPLQRKEIITTIGPLHFRFQQVFVAYINQPAFMTPKQFKMHLMWDI